MKLFLTDPTSHRAQEAVANLGDIIIKDAVEENFPQRLRENIAAWVDIDSHRQKLRRNDVLVLAGANIISNSPFLNPSVWRPSFVNALGSQYVVLFGIGWWQYQRDPDVLTRLFYKRYLMRGPIQHSVRDSYTKQMLAKCGIQNVINTGCPTMWRLPERLSFGTSKPDSVVFTLTDYNKHPVHDKALLELLLQCYRNLRFFPQGTDDASYLGSIATNEQLHRIHVLDRSISAYNLVLEQGDIDYVGTRLHAGIRALQRGRRAIVVAVDNRAVEIAKDTNLPVVKRDDYSVLKQKLHDEFDVKLKIDHEGVEAFKKSAEVLVGY